MRALLLVVALAALAVLVAFAVATPTRVVWWGGQSLSQGADTATTTTQSLGNKMVSGTTYDGVSFITVVPSPAWPLTDLVESGTESPRTAMANAYATATGYPVVIAIDSRGGSPYTLRKVGTFPFTYAVNTIQAVAEHANCATVVGAVDIGGETDERDGITRVAYAADLVEHQAAIQAAAQARLPLTGTVHLCVQQLSSWGVGYEGSHTYSTIAMGQYDAALNSPVIEISHPGEAAPYMVDEIHHTSAGADLDGVYLDRCIRGGKDWKPIRPSSIVRVGNVIHVEWYVPTPPLVMMCDVYSDPGNYGFDVENGTIISVTPSASGTGTDILVSGTVTLLGYARIATPGHGGGPTYGPRGCIRDTASPANVGIHWESAIPGP